MCAFSRAYLFDFFIVNIKSSLTHLSENVKDVLWSRNEISVEVHEETLLAKGVYDDSVVDL